MFPESRGDESTGRGDGVAPLAERKGEDVPDMRHARPNFQLHGDVGLGGPRSQTRGIIQENLR